MKKIIFIILLILIVFLIYYFNIDKKTHYLSLGDYLSYGLNNFENKTEGYSKKIKKHYKSNLKNYINYSTYDDYRTVDLINDIKCNKEIKYKGKKYKLQNLLVKSNLITISIGMNDLLYKKNIDYDYVDNLIKDIEELLTLVRKYNKDKIYLLGYYNAINNKEIIEYTNKRLKKICNKKNINYVDISKLDSYILNNKYPTNDGYKYITNQILNFTK